MDHEETRVTLRLPSDLRKWLTQQARTNRRSLNAELVHRLESDYRTAATDTESP
ncbi:Arc family DNA-binding protein [Streptomyces cyaneofuscatus]|uniref:Arc family DNA-binding protein n=1 Tax=unclassified Streptomyces TaxID=2593676 RepID=UPI000978FCCC|nr:MULTISPECIES: Arc family DNA-binding protein [unclassified Streptomyces]ONI50448.1 Arc-like DNA binding domain protein [Streptomyces sp. IB2014 011-1]RDV47331.1 Arc family DNA-binding protein [Streptomyces sp. IB2014 011-12]